MGLSFHGMNTALYAIGDTGEEQGLSYRTEEKKDEARKQYEKILLCQRPVKGSDSDWGFIQDGGSNGTN